MRKQSNKGSGIEVISFSCIKVEFQCIHKPLKCPFKLSTQFPTKKEIFQKKIGHSSSYHKNIWTKFREQSSKGAFFVESSQPSYIVRDIIHYFPFLWDFDALGSLVIMSCLFITWSSKSSHCFSFEIIDFLPIFGSVDNGGRDSIPYFKEIGETFDIPFKEYMVKDLLGNIEEIKSLFSLYALTGLLSLG